MLDQAETDARAASWSGLEKGTSRNYNRGAEGSVIDIPVTIAVLVVSDIMLAEMLNAKVN